jgi:hypothetical protein
MRSNARHHPPRTQRIKDGVSRMKATLFAVGCMPLLCGGPHFDEPPANFFSSNLRNLTALL